MIGIPREVFQNERRVTCVALTQQNVSLSQEGICSSHGRRSAGVEAQLVETQFLDEQYVKVGLST